MYQTQPLRVNFRGEFKFKLRTSTVLSSIANGGYIDISMCRKNTMGSYGGFSGPTSNMVCTVYKMSTQ